MYILCNFSNTDFDVVFLQEVWYKDDYNFLKDCTKSRYRITKFDEECGRLNPVCFNSDSHIYSRNSNLKVVNYFYIDDTP